MKHKNPYYAFPQPVFLKVEDGSTYFTYLGRTYRTDPVRYVIQVLDRGVWNRTRAAAVYAAAKQILEQNS
jgi:hypothetical protein